MTRAAASVPLQRIAVTGSSGYYGRVMIRLFRERLPEARILGIDIRPAQSHPPDEFHALDVRSDEVREVLREFAPDTLLHFAFVVNPLHDEQEMRSINVEGTRNLLAITAEIRPHRLLVASSATAYGAWADNPIPIDDRHPVRPREEFRYSADKGEMESLLAKFAESEPEIEVSWTRPCVICGDSAGNYIIDALLMVPFMMLPGGSDTPLQFVDEDDLAEATYVILSGGGRGPYNLAPPDWLPLSEIGREMKITSCPVPFWLGYGFSKCWWMLRLPWFRFPPSFWYFMQHPWVVGANRLAREFDFRFKRTSREAFRRMLKAQG